MKKYIIAAIMSVAASIGMAADQYALLVNMTDGKTVEYQFEFNPVATFDGDEMIIIDDYDGIETRYDMANIVNMTIKKPTVGVESVDTAGLKIAVTRQHLAVAGLAEGAVVNIFNVAGAVVASANANADGTVNITLDNLGSGVFVVAMPGNSFKFIR